MKHIVCLLLFVAGAHCARAQSGIEGLLDSIRANNPALVAAERYAAARNAEYRTGLFLYDPQVAFDYYKGSPSTAGDQINFELTQSFDFPTAYRYRRQLSRLQRINTTPGLARQRQETLLEAKLLYIDIVFATRKQHLLQRRLTHAKTLEADFQKKLSIGEGNVLDLNKAKLQRVHLEIELRLNAAQQAVETQRLQALNGGEQLRLVDTVYPGNAALPAFESLEAVIEAADPTLRSLQGVVDISEAQLRLQRSLSLPRFEAGYYYQGILGQTFNGVHTGLSLPLWKKRNAITHRRLQLDAEKQNVEAHRNEHYYEIKALYQQYIQQDSSYKQLAQILSSLSSEYLLEKAFRYGELSSVEYFMELKYFYSSQDQLLELDRQRQQTLARLYKYQL